MEAFIPAAGLGTRLKPLTDNLPKALIEIKGVPLLERLIYNLKKISVNHIVINVHHHSSKVLEFLAANDNFGIDISISDETDELLDTGGGLKKAFPLLRENDFLIHNVDILTGIDLPLFLEKHKASGRLVTLAVQKRNSSRYFLFDESGLLCGWENVKTGEIKISRTPKGRLNRLAFSGIHAVNHKLYPLLSRDKAFSIIDSYLSIAKEREISYFDHSNTCFVDLGKIENLKEAEGFFRNEKD